MNKQIDYKKVAVFEVTPDKHPTLGSFTANPLKFPVFDFFESPGGETKKKLRLTLDYCIGFDHQIRTLFTSKRCAEIFSKLPKKSNPGYYLLVDDKDQLIAVPMRDCFISVRRSWHNATEILRLVSENDQILIEKLNPFWDAPVLTYF